MNNIINNHYDEALSDDFKAVIAWYQAERLNCSTSRSVKIQLEQISNFMLFMMKHGIYDDKSINGNLVSLYLDEERKKNGIYSGIVAMKLFLQSLAKKGIIPSYLPLLSTAPVQASALLFELNNSDLNVLKNLSGKKSEITLYPTSYWEKALEMTEHLKGKNTNAEKNLRDKYIVHLQMLYVLLSELKIDFTPSVSKYWVNMMEKLPAFKGFSGARKSCMDKFLFYLVHGNVFIVRKLPHQYKSDTNMAKLSDHFKSIILHYLSEEQKDNFSRSTIEVHRSGAVSFMRYIEMNGVHEIESITPTLVKGYNNAMAAASCNGKNNYLYDVKSFLRFLFAAGYTKSDFSKSLPSRNAASRRIVEILSESEIQMIECYCLNASTPFEIRDAAILSLGLYMGFRGIDIVSLKYCDIDWGSMEISITQQKTYRPIVLPMSLLVGTRIRNYILKGRPKVPNGYVFLSHESPFNNVVSTHICRDALRRATNEKCSKFHILRRTFASRLLATGSDTSMIKDSLGHSDYSSVNRYLATDIVNEKLCCLPIKRTVMKSEAST